MTPMKPREYILALARSFPCLRGKVAHLTPESWDVEAFIKASAAWSTGERLAALFIARVWNASYADMQGWQFDIVHFMAIADSGNRGAMAAWCQRPYIP